MTIEKSKMRYGIGWLCALLLLLTSCKDEDWYGNGHCPEGEPATISLKISIPDMDVKTRAMNEEADSRVSNLWVGVYNKSTKKQTGMYYSGDDENWKESSIVEHADYKFSINTQSGESYIVAVANVDSHYGISDNSELREALGITDNKRTTLKTLLEKADTWEKFKSISAILLDETNVNHDNDQNVVMSGVYYEGKADQDRWNTGDDINTVVIKAGDSNLNGCIHLRRLFAHVKFNLQAAENITITPKSWQVCNVPMIAYLHEQGQNAADVSTFLTEEKNYNDSRTSLVFNATANNFSFEFYQFENKHEGLQTVRSYADREKEYKNANDLNTGIYQSLCTEEQKINGEIVNNNATTVRVIADVSYYYVTENNVETVTTESTENATLRTGTVVYTIHLGYCEGVDEATKSRDFNCRRNTEYTYNVTVKGLNDIVVEVRDSKETSPGAEGNVTDIGEIRYELDAHYCTFNIKLTKDERKNMNWKIRAPYDGVAYECSSDKEDNDPMYYKWIGFMPTQAENRLAEYDPEMVWNLVELSDPETYNTENEWFTVFVDEYVYPDETANDKNDGTNDTWKKYVNQADRIAWINVSGSQISKDGESSYDYAKYMISQKSIQTYYDTNSSNVTTALGVEHINETYGKNLTWKWTKKYEDLSHSNGRWNMWQYVKDINWSDIITNDSPDNKNYPVCQLQSTSDYDIHNNYPDKSKPTTFYEIISACMSRNRDLNKDKTIDANELRWYLPALGKYERIMLGRATLPSPLFDPNAVNYTNPADPIAAPWTESISGGNSNEVHYATSDQVKFFPEEGGSYFNGNLGIWWNDPNAEFTNRYPWNIRCIRNLGVRLDKVTENAGDDPVARAYTYLPDDWDNRTGGGVFKMDKYTNNSLRAPVSTFISVHTIKDFSSNSVAASFRVSKDKTSYTLQPGETVESVLNKNLPCKNYKEDGDDANTVWRAPNQRELMIILNEELYSDNVLQSMRYSCTKEYYGDANRFVVAVYGTSGWQMQMASPVVNNSFDVRCVRDVIENTRGN